MNNPQDLIKTEKALSEYQGEDRVMLASDLKEEFKSSLEKVVFLKSGLPTFDNLTGGFYTGELIIVTGMPKRGKSTWLRTVTKNLLKQDIKSLWFPFDMPLFSFMSAFGEELPVFYLPRMLKQEAMEWLHARIWESKVKYDIKAVFIDDLGYLVDLIHSRNPSVELGTICRQLKRLAIEKNIIIFLAHHSTKVETGKDPTENNLRDSGLIAGVADKVITIQRKKDSAEGRLIINIDRFSGTLQKSVNIILNGQYYEEVSLYQEPEKVEEEEPKMNPFL